MALDFQGYVLAIKHPKITTCIYLQDTLNFFSEATLKAGMIPFLAARRSLGPFSKEYEGLVFTHPKPGWWFQICFYFHPYLGKWLNLTNIFRVETTNQKHFMRHHQLLNYNTHTFRTISIRQSKLHMSILGQTVYQWFFPHTLGRYPNPQKERIPS